jgi:hypothetical protein
MGVAQGLLVFLLRFLLRFMIGDLPVFNLALGVAW